MYKIFSSLCLEPDFCSSIPEGGGVLLEQSVDIQSASVMHM
jgi:hypothetical protein